MQNGTKKQKKQPKRTHMTGAELKSLRRDMRFDPRDMCATFNLPRRTYQNYENGERGIPAKLAEQIREKHRQDREWINGIGERIDAAEREYK